MDGIETLRIVHFDRSGSVLAVMAYAGHATRVELPVRTIIADALSLSTSGLLLSHNHPSGDPTPSRQDIAATYHLARAAGLFDIRLHDHLVIGAGRNVSFRAMGLL